MIDIEFYDTEEGSCPVQEYLDTLEPKLLAKHLEPLICWKLMELSLECHSRNILKMASLSCGQNRALT